MDCCYGNSIDGNSAVQSIFEVSDTIENGSCAQERCMSTEKWVTMNEGTTSVESQENFSVFKDMEISDRINNENTDVDDSSEKSSLSKDAKNSVPVENQNNCVDFHGSSSVSKDTVGKNLRGSSKRKQQRSKIKKQVQKVIYENFEQDYDLESIRIKEEPMSSENTNTADILETVTDLDGLIQSVNCLYDEETEKSLVTIKEELQVVEGDNSGLNDKTPQDCYFDVSARKRRKVKGAVKNFCCAHCTFTSIRWDRLKEHLIVHLEERPFSCDICDFKAKTAKTLKRHKSIHSRERSYQCPKCSVSYKRKHSLKEHLMAHSKEQTFVCSVCNFSTSRSQYLKRHMMKHTQEKLYCHFCNYETVYASKLKRHLEVHTGRQRAALYHCSKCDYKSVHSQCVRQHEKTHDKETVYQCGICEFTAGTSETLRIHMRMHINGGNQYKCDNCSYETMRKRDIKRHYLRVHSMKKNFT